MNPRNPDDHDPFNTKRPTVYHISGWRRLVLLPFSGLLYLYLLTLRFRITEEDRQLLRGSSRPRLLVLWHNRGLIAPMVFHRLLDPSYITIMVSPSKMAAWQAAFYELLRLNVVRGSSTRRSIQGTLETLRSIRQGNDAGMAPDGPSGPLYSFKAGSVAMARRLGVPMLLMMPNTACAFHLKGWDRHLVPWPFARITVRLKAVLPGDPIWENSDAAVARELRRVCLEMTEDRFNVEP